MRRTASVAIAAVGLASLSVMAMAGKTTSDQQGVSVIRAGASSSSEGPADNFTGHVCVEGRFQRQAPARVGGGTVIFEPGARTAWHTHPLGQTLVVAQGRGFVQEMGTSCATDWPRLRGVDSARREALARRRAAPGEAMTHVAIAESKDANAVTWLEKVSDVQYADAVRRHE